jgi:general secretion pathway protein E
MSSADGNRLDGGRAPGNIADDEVDQSLLERVPLGFVKRNMVLPLKLDGHKLTVAISDPKNLFALDDLGRRFSARVSPRFVPQQAIIDAINRFYERLSGTAQEVIDELQAESIETLAHEFEEPRDLIELADEAPIIRLLNSIMLQAVKESASDVHVEPFERKIEVRLRKDGVLYHLLGPPKHLHEPLISRIKIMAGLDIAEKRLPQDGRIRLLVGGRDVDIRVSVVPTAFGERAVLRLLDRKKGLITLSEIGLADENVRSMEGLLDGGEGVILVTGPTGSGKTTTLYAAIKRINSIERNVITIEDPIEYQLDQVGQMQVNPKIDFTFANGLRSILRQDPDVIMVGEIRDRETAAMAVQAALTGHLVLSTLHTNDAASAVARLVDMGVEPFLLSSTLSAVLAQRLVRILCVECREGYSPGPAEAALFEGSMPAPARLYRAKGCPACFKTGYQGRVGIFEFLKVTDEIKSVLIKNPDSTTIKRHALLSGMKTLRDDGLSKAASGMTSVEEVLRTTRNE